MSPKEEKNIVIEFDEKGFAFIKSFSGMTESQAKISVCLLGANYVAQKIKEISGKKG